MKRNVIETVLGAVVLFVAGFFLVFSYQTSNVGAVNGYNLVAHFSGIGGLRPGDEVQISGVKIGTVTDVSLTQDDTYLALVTITIDNSIHVPSDTVALISSEGLLGGRYMALEPGGDEETLKPGERIRYTQAPQNLEQLLGQFIFSMQDDGGNTSQ